MIDSSRNTAAVVSMAALLAGSFEGIRQTAYSDPVGILTVCYGTTTNVQRNRTYSIDECKSMLDRDMRIAVDHVEQCAPGLPMVIWAAFADAVYNLGPTIVCNTRQSTAARYLAAGKFDLACNELPRWDKARLLGVMITLPGLTKRRQAERELCLKGVA